MIESLEGGRLWSVSLSKDHMDDFYCLILGLPFLVLLDITNPFWERGQDKYQSLAI